jgi:hypothetical protein
MNESAFGASTGQIGDLASQNLTNDFNTVPNNDITGNLGTDRVQPRDIATGVMRGTQRYISNDGSYMTTGEVPGQTGPDGKPLFGLAFFDSSGNLQAMYLGTTDYKYTADGINYYQSGELPDGSRNVAISKDGTSVEDAFA